MFVSFSFLYIFYGYSQSFILDLMRLVFTFLLLSCSLHKIEDEVDPSAQVNFDFVIFVFVLQFNEVAESF